MVLISNISVEMFPLLLKGFVNERLKAAADEIFNVFERTIAKYEEEASVSKQEIERLRGLLLEQKTDTSEFSACEDKSPHEQHHCEQELTVSIRREDPQPPHIKEEDNEFWTTERKEEEKTGERTDLSHPPQSGVWDENNQDDRKPLTQTCEPMDEFQETREAHFSSPPALTSQNEMVNDAEEPAASCISDQPKTEQLSLIVHQESTEVIRSELSDLNSAGAQHQCYLCTKSFSSGHQLVKHAFCFHSKDSGVTCAVCGITLESTESVDAHLKTHKGSKCCHICGKHCNSKTALTEHMAGHAGVKLHRCHVCGKECSRKGDLKIHIRIHTGEKPFCCSFCCKSFTHSGHLRKHMRSHTGERPHRCEICGRGFLQSTHLKYHLGTHTQKY